MEHRKPSEASEGPSFLFSLSASEEALEERVIVELMIVKELGEEIICVVEVEVMEGVSLGSIEAVHVIGPPLVGISEVFVGLGYFSKLL